MCGEPLSQAAGGFTHFSSVKSSEFCPSAKTCTSLHVGHFVTNVEASISHSGVSKKLAAKARMNVIGAISRAKMPTPNIPPNLHL